MKKRLLTILAVVVGLLITGTLVTASIWPVLNVVATGETPEYADVLPQYFSADPKRVFTEAAAAAAALDKWTVTTSDPDAQTVEATRETSMMGFVDDITVTVTPQTEFVTRVHVRSASRVGKSDFGQNARNIREFQAELDRRLGAVRFDPFAAAKADTETAE